MFEERPHWVRDLNPKESLSHSWVTQDGPRSTSRLKQDTEKLSNC